MQYTPSINQTTGLATIPKKADGSAFYKLLYYVANGKTHFVGKPRYDSTDVNAYFNVLAGDTWADIVAAAQTANVTLPPNPNIGP